MALLTPSASAGPGRPAQARRGLARLLLLLFFGPSLLPAQATTPHEYQVKAVFLFNFAQFVDWPPTVFADPRAPLVIGVLGEDPFGSVLDDTLRGEMLGERAIVIRRYRRREDIDHCHILFIGRSEGARLESIIRGLRGRHILTVSDTTGSALRGVMIRFVTENSKIRFRINLDAAKAAGLVISSKLLRPAEIVTNPEG
jgi:hypothetical protein